MLRYRVPYNNRYTHTYENISLLQAGTGIEHVSFSYTCDLHVHKDSLTSRNLPGGIALRALVTRCSTRSESC